jgi:hypothetical protein
MIDVFEFALESPRAQRAARGPRSLPFYAIR